MEDINPIIKQKIIDEYRQEKINKQKKIINKLIETFSELPILFYILFSSALISSLGTYYYLFIVNKLDHWLLVPLALYTSSLFAIGIFIVSLLAVEFYHIGRNLRDKK